MPNRITDSGFKDWRPERLPGLTGKTYVITGGNSGIGLEAARMLGRAGADIVLACRSAAKGEAAARTLAPQCMGTVEAIELDLASMASIRAAAKALHESKLAIDGLVNNAGIMQTPKRETRDGFELQFGTNHLGHFLWTALMLERVEAAAGRVVTVSSIAHKMGKMDAHDLAWARGYTPSKAYFRSKLANLLFAFELDRRLTAAGARAVSIACHPGYSNTRLQSTGPTGLTKAIYKITNPLLAQSAIAGAIPTVLAAAGTEARRGAYYGPTGFVEARGPVGDALVADGALDEDLAGALWRASEELVGEPFTITVG